MLLTAYADTEAAIAAINEVALDYYLLKPWDPPEEQLFPVVEDLLDDLGGGRRAGGRRACASSATASRKDSHDLRDFLARNRVPARWLDVERDGEARELLEVAGVDDDRLPVALLEDGSVLERPTVLELAERLGVAGAAGADHYDLVIVGGGPPGLAAAVYGASEGLRTVLVEREAPGGQAGQSSRIENYLGFPTGLSGSDLARRATDQARRLGRRAADDPGRRSALRAEGAGRIVELSGGGDAERELRARRLGRLLPPARRARASPSSRAPGIYYGAALTEARSCARPARRRHRRRQLGRPGGGVLQRLREQGHDARARRLARASSMSHYLIEQIAALPNVEVRTGTQARRGRGQTGISAACASATPTAASPRARPTPASSSSAPRRAPTGSRASSRATSAASSSPGSTPRPPGWPLKRDPYLLETTVPGVFVAGDVRARSIKRVASAVGEGSMSVSLIHQYLVDG